MCGYPHLPPAPVPTTLGTAVLTQWGGRCSHVALRKHELPALLPVSVTVHQQTSQQQMKWAGTQEHSCAEEGEGISTQHMLLSAVGSLWVLVPESMVCRIAISFLQSLETAVCSSHA